MEKGKKQFIRIGSYNNPRRYKGSLESHVCLIPLHLDIEEMGHWALVVREYLRASGKVTCYYIDSINSQRYSSYVKQCLSETPIFPQNAEWILIKTIAQTEVECDAQMAKNMLLVADNISSNPNSAIPYLVSSNMLLKPRNDWDEREEVTGIVRTWNKKCVIDRKVYNLPDMNEYPIISNSVGALLSTTVDLCG